MGSKARAILILLVSSLAIRLGGVFAVMVLTFGGPRTFSVPAVQALAIVEVACAFATVFALQYVRAAFLTSLTVMAGLVWMFSAGRNLRQGQGDANLLMVQSFLIGVGSWLLVGVLALVTLRLVNGSPLGDPKGTVPNGR